MSGPRVLTLVPAFNPDPEMLRASLASLVAQTMETAICLIDDGSDVPLADCVADLPNIIHLRLAQNSGITRALIAGVQLGLKEGIDYLGRLDVGDLAHPQRVARQMAHMEAHSDIALLGSLAVLVDGAGKEVGCHGVRGGPVHVQRYLRVNAAFKHSTFMIRASAIRRYGNYDAAFAMAQDYELALRFARYATVDCLPEPLIDYHVDPRGLSLKHRRRQLCMRLKAQLRHADLRQPLWYYGVGRLLAQLWMPRTLAQHFARMRWRTVPKRVTV